MIDDFVEFVKIILNNIVQPFHYKKIKLNLSHIQGNDYFIFFYCNAVSKVKTVLQLKISTSDAEDHEIYE